MEILIIGNGFDLEHKLPTTYRDFLQFCSNVIPIFSWDLGKSVQQYQNSLTGWKINEHIKKMLVDAFKTRYIDKTSIKDMEYDMGIRTNNDKLNELYSYIKFNTWLRYFEKCSSKFGENWIDFESEISKVIQALDAIKYQVSIGDSIDTIDKNKQDILLKILQASKGNLRDISNDVSKIVRYGSFLYSELEKLIRALEIYLAVFVDQISISHKSPDIETMCPQYVLSFNYTNTYFKIYGNDQVECDYIHGKAESDNNVETCDIVLGIDEYLKDEMKDIDLDFLTFKKYYQRIYKSTGNKYLDWVDIIKESYAEYIRILNENSEGQAKQALQRRQSIPGQISSHSDFSDIKFPQHTVYIFGHSLDVTDKDILKMFICNDNVLTKIFYYRQYENDKRSLGKLIKNLVLIMGQEELIRRTGGAHKSIEFIPQTIHEE